MTYMSLQRRAQLAASGNSGSKQARALANIHPAQDGSEATHFAWSALYIRLVWSIPGQRVPLGPKPTSNPVQVCRNQCRVASFVLACARKKRIISRLASGPRASV
jgi:hypothetical protein